MEIAFAVVYVLSLRTASAAAFCRSATTAAHALRFAMHSPRELAELCNGFVACKYSADELSSNLCTQPPSVSDVHATAMRKYVSTHLLHAARRLLSLRVQLPVNLR